MGLERGVTSLHSPIENAVAYTSPKEGSIFESKGVCRDVFHVILDALLTGISESRIERHVASIDSSGVNVSLAVKSFRAD